MRFEPLEIAGAMLIRIEPHTDRRGLFARTVCVEEFRRHGVPADFVQASVSYNRRRGTVRGMHFQWPPSREGKLVRCVRGAIHDVLLDIRPGEPTYLQHRAVVLDQENRDAVFIPPGVAHGFQTLAEESEILYQMTDFHAPDLAGGMRWNDPALGIDWPIRSDVTISERDAGYPDFDSGQFARELAQHQQR